MGGKTGHDQTSRLMADPATRLWEVFIRARNGLSHRHAGSVHAADPEMAMQAARDVYTRRGEGLSIWVVPSAALVPPPAVGFAPLGRSVGGDRCLRSVRQGHIVRTGCLENLPPSDVL